MIACAAHTTSHHRINLDNRRFMRTLAEVLHRPFIIPSVPGFTLRLLVGDVADVLLNGSAVSGRKLEAAGFTAHHRELREAMADLCS